LSGEARPKGKRNVWGKAKITRRGDAILRTNNSPLEFRNAVSDEEIIKNGGCAGERSKNGDIFPFSIRFTASS
jgi:hypothetical protein